MQILCPPKLGVGRHAADDDERCVWEAVNIALTGNLSDECPPCTHPALHAAVLRANDAVSDAARPQVWPYALRALGTASRDSAEIAAAAMRYAFKCADEAVRVHAPAALEAAGLRAEADKLRALPPIDSASSASSAASSAARSAMDAYSAADGLECGRSARTAARSARTAADSADSAAYSARSATRGAAGGASGAAYSARSAACSAHSAAYSAARSSASAAGGASNSASSAARSATRGAADAAYSAARSSASAAGGAFNSAHLGLLAALLPA